MVVPPLKSALSSRAIGESGLFLGVGGGVSPDGGVRDRRRERGRLLVCRRGEGVRRLVGARCLEIRRLERRGVGLRRALVPGVVVRVVSVRGVRVASVVDAVVDVSLRLSGSACCFWIDQSA